MKFKKTEILFRRKSLAGEHACLNGEIANAENALLVGCSKKTVPASSAETPEPSENIYSPVGTAAPAGGISAPYVSFGLKEDVLTGWHNHPANPPSREVAAPKERDASSWGLVAASLYSEFEREADDSHLFLSPFLAICAVRLPDGSRVAAGPPVLLTPNRDIPSVEGGDNLDVSSMKMTVAVHPCRLSMRVTGPLSTHLSSLAATGAWLDVLVSGPIPLWDSSRPWKPYHRAAGSSSTQCWRPSALTEESVTAHLLTTSTFRLISTSPLSGVCADGIWRDVVLNVPPLEGIDVVEEWRPDYLQAHGIEAVGCSVISGRMTLWDLTLTLPEALPYAVMARLSPASAEEEGGRISVDIESVKDGAVVHTVRNSAGHPAGVISDATLPRWLFVPDADARSITFLCDGAVYRFPLSRHPCLAGSFFWAGSFGCEVLSAQGVVKYSGGSVPVEEIDERPVYRLPSAIWRSQRGNHTCFPDSLLMRSDDARVLALCRAFRSSGLVATTAPTAYLFTDSGLYLLREMDDATFRDAGLIGRFILGDMMTIAGYGRSLQFRDNSDRLLEVSGTTVKVVADEADAGESVSDETVPGERVIVRSDGVEDVDVVTRALKVEGVGGGKMWSVGLLGAVNWGELRLAVEGSTDLVRWRELASTLYVYGNSTGSGTPSVCGLLTPGLRYFRFRFSGFFSGTAEGIVVSR